MMRLLPFLTAFAALCLPASAGVNFVANFEPGSRWFTQSWSAAARTEMQAFLTDLGNLFDSDATVRINITDDETDDPLGGAYASAGSDWRKFHPIPDFGNVYADALWLIIVKGIHNPAVTSDATINWNLDITGLYGGNSASLIGNIRGLARHEMHHALGSSSYIGFDTTYDPRGKLTYASVIDTLYRDANGNRLLGAFNPANNTYTMNNFVISPNWASAGNPSGLYVEARDLQGRVVQMPPLGGPTFLDFSHVRGISYVNDHPTWNTYVYTDFNFLRAMGYPLMVDSALRSQPAKVTAYDFAAAATASLTSQSLAGKHYRLATSTDLKRWSVGPVGKPGTGSPLAFTYPIDRATDPKRFFQVVEVSP